MGTEKFELIASFIVYLTFCLVFVLRPTKTRWWRDAYGQMVLFAHAALTLLLADTVAAIYWPRFAAHRWLGVALLGLLLVAGMWQLGALVASTLRGWRR